MPNYANETIGVIGGCGVAAANELMCRMERRLTELGCCDDPQQPDVILFQATHAPNRIAFASGKSKISFVPYFTEVGKKLKSCGATICCIPCNTAHCAIREIESAVGIPFIDVVNETLLHIATEYPAARKIGILCSSGTRIAEIYQSHAKEIECRCEFLFPSDGLQMSVDEGIAAVKAGLQYSHPARAEKFFSVAADDLLSLGADVIVLGCTEIPLALKAKFFRGKPVIDTITVLVDACIGRCKSGDHSHSSAGQPSQI
ncbi:MAG: amino acid racemase [Puniceicoccales bacterium]|jgi:aspartate racemase|nr:amino acid racemase [Puniceicoccales bacterium]